MGWLDAIKSRVHSNENDNCDVFTVKMKKDVIIYNPDYSIVNVTIKILGKKYTYKNQRIKTFAREYLDN